MRAPEALGAPEALVALAALLVLTAGVDVVARHAPAPASAAAAPAAAAAPRGTAVAVRVSVPALDLDRPLVPLDRTADGALQVPSDTADVGRWTGRGPVVLAGHVDSRDGPAVFSRLRDLRAGDAVVLTTTTGPQRYVVERVRTVAKRDFPTFEVFTGTGLRLITCGGRFDRRAGSYDDNVVVWARAAAAGPA